MTKQLIRAFPLSIVSLAMSVSLFPTTGCKPTKPTTQMTSMSNPASPDSKEPAFTIPFEKFQLENGLTVILHRDTSDPIVAMMTLVHVGSSREKPGRTGFAHFFEHMSFNNSENVPMGANRKMIPELGGTRNGGTWSDGTIYYEVVPKDAFEKLMWIDSDRLGYMINTVKEGTLEREKQVVKNEKRQRVDNRPYGHTGYVVRKALYPEGHPYNWTVIGELEDLQRATLADVREFYERFYVPSNATLVVAGDIDIEKTKELVQTWFGEIKAGQPVADLEPMPVRLAATKRLSHEDGFAKAAEIRLTFPTVEDGHPDTHALDALASVLGDGKNAPLFKVVTVENKLSAGPWASQSSNELAGTFTIGVRANPGVALDDVYASIGKALSQFESDGVRAEDLQRIIAVSKSGFYRGLEGVLGKARLLGQFEEFTGDPANLFRELDKIAAVTEADVTRVYQKYIVNKPSVITSFVPKGQGALALSGSSPAKVVEEAIVSGAEKEFVEDTSENFTRTKSVHDRSEPPLGPTPSVRTPTVWRDQAPNNLKILGIEQREIPMVSFQLRIDGGQMLDPASKLGTASLVADMLNEGTANKTPLELEDAIELLGSRISINGGRTSISVSGQAQAEHFGATMALVSEMLLEPRWDSTEFERLKTAQLSSIEQRVANPTWVARNAFGRQVYGLKHVEGQPFGGTAKTVTPIELDELKSWFSAKVGANVATLHVVGAVNRADVVAATERLRSEWGAVPISAPNLPEPMVPASPRLFFVDIPGAKQSVIYVGKPVVSGYDPSFYKLTVANDRLGRGSSARLTQTLRIAKGYSYGAFSTFTRRPFTGAFIASSQVRTNVTLESLEIFRDLIGNYASTFADGDLATTKNLLSKGDTRRFETLNQLRGVLETMTRYNLPDNYVALQSKELQSMTLAEAKQLISKHLRTDQMTYVIVGDAATQLARVEKFGLGKPVMLDRNGAPIVGSPTR